MPRIPFTQEKSLSASQKLKHQSFSGAFLVKDTWMKWCNYFRNNLWSNTVDSLRAVRSPAVHIQKWLFGSSSEGMLIRWETFLLGCYSPWKQRPESFCSVKVKELKAAAKPVQIGKKISLRIFLMRRLVPVGCIPQEWVQPPCAKSPLFRLL